MPFPNFHAARVKSPGLFSRIRVLRTLSSGVMIYGGNLKRGGGSAVQTYRFPKSRFTPEQARAWLRRNNIKYIMFERASG